MSNSVYPPFKGNYSDYVRYVEDKRYYLVKAQRNKPLLDSEINEISEGLLTQVRRSIQNTFGDGIPYEEFGAVPFVGTGSSSPKHAVKKDAFRVVPNSGNLGNDFKVKGGRGVNDPAVLYYNGWYLFLTGDVAYSDQMLVPPMNQDPLVVPGYTATRIPSLNTHSGTSPRYDVVYMEFRLAEVSSETGNFQAEYMDPKIQDNVLGSPTANRLRAIMDIRVLEDAASEPDWGTGFVNYSTEKDRALSIYGLSFFAESSSFPMGSGNEAYTTVRMPIAVITRDGSGVAISSGDIFDLADNLGTRIYTSKEVSHRLRNGGYNATTIVRAPTFPGMESDINWDDANANTNPNLRVFTYESTKSLSKDEGLTSKAFNSDSVTPRVLSKYGRFSMAAQVLANTNEVYDQYDSNWKNLLAHPDELLAGEQSLTSSFSDRVMLGYSRNTVGLARTLKSARENAATRGQNLAIRISSKDYRSSTGGTYTKDPDKYQGGIYLDVDYSEDSLVGAVYMPGVVSNDDDTNFGFLTGETRLPVDIELQIGGAPGYVPMSSGFVLDRYGNVGVNLPVPANEDLTENRYGIYPDAVSVPFRGFARSFFLSSKASKHTSQDFESQYKILGAFDRPDLRLQEDRHDGSRVSELYGVRVLGSRSHLSTSKVFGKDYVYGSRITEGDSFTTADGGLTILGVERQRPTLSKPSLSGSNAYNNDFIENGERIVISVSEANKVHVGGFGSAPDTDTLATHGSVEVLNNTGLTVAADSGEFGVKAPSLTDSYLQFVYDLSDPLDMYASPAMYEYKVFSGTKYRRSGIVLADNPFITSYYTNAEDFLALESYSNFANFADTAQYSFLPNLFAREASVTKITGDLHNIRRADNVVGKLAVAVGTILADGSVVDGSVITEEIAADRIVAKSAAIRSVRSKVLDTLNSFVGTRELYADKIIREGRSKFLTLGEYAIFPEAQDGHFIPVATDNPVVDDSDFPAYSERNSTNTSSGRKHRKAFTDRMGNTIMTKSFFYDEVVIGSDPLFSHASTSFNLSRNKSFTNGSGNVTPSFVDENGNMLTGAVPELPMGDVAAYVGGTLKSRHVFASGNTSGEWGSVVLFKGRKNRWSEYEDFFSIRGESKNIPDKNFPSTLGNGSYGDVDDYFSRKGVGSAANGKTVHIGGRGIDTIVFDKSVSNNNGVDSSKDIEIVVEGGVTAKVARIDDLYVDKIHVKNISKSVGMYQGGDTSLPIAYHSVLSGGFHTDILLKSEERETLTLVGNLSKPLWSTGSDYVDGISQLSFPNENAIASLSTLAILNAGKMYVTFPPRVIADTTDYRTEASNTSRKLLDKLYRGEAMYKVSPSSVHFTPVDSLETYDAMDSSTESKYRVNVNLETVLAITTTDSSQARSYREVSKSFVSSIPLCDMDSWFAYAIDSNSNAAKPGYSYYRSMYRGGSSTFGWSDETAYFTEVPVFGYGSSVSPFEKMYVQIVAAGADEDKALIVFKTELSFNAEVPAGKTDGIVHLQVPATDSNVSETVTLTVFGNSHVINPGVDPEQYISFSKDSAGKHFSTLGGSPLSNAVISPIIRFESGPAVSKGIIEIGAKIKLAVIDVSNKYRDSVIAMGSQLIPDDYPPYMKNIPLTGMLKDPESTWLDACLTLPGFTVETEFSVISSNTRIIRKSSLNGVNGNVSSVKLDVYLATTAKELKSLYKTTMEYRVKQIAPLIYNGVEANGTTPIPRYLDGFFFDKEYSSSYAYTYANRIGSYFMTAAQPYTGVYHTGDAATTYAWGQRIYTSSTEFYLNPLESLRAGGMLENVGYHLNGLDTNIIPLQLYGGDESAVVLDVGQYYRHQAYFDPQTLRIVTPITYQYLESQVEQTGALYTVVPGNTLSKDDPLLNNELGESTLLDSIGDDGLHYNGNPYGPFGFSGTAGDQMQVAGYTNYVDKLAIGDDLHYFRNSEVGVAQTVMSTHVEKSNMFSQRGIFGNLKRVAEMYEATVAPMRSVYGVNPPESLDFIYINTDALLKQYLQTNLRAGGNYYDGFMLLEYGYDHTSRVYTYTISKIDPRHSTVEALPVKSSCIIRWDDATLDKVLTLSSGGAGTPPAPMNITLRKLGLMIKAGNGLRGSIIQYAPTAGGEPVLAKTDAIGNPLEFDRKYIYTGVQISEYTVDGQGNNSTAWGTTNTTASPLIRRCGVDRVEYKAFVKYTGDGNILEPMTRYEFENILDKSGLYICASFGSGKLSAPVVTDASTEPDTMGQSTHEDGDVFWNYYSICTPSEYHFASEVTSPIPIKNLGWDEEITLSANFYKNIPGTSIYNLPEVVITTTIRICDLGILWNRSSNSISQHLYDDNYLLQVFDENGNPVLVNGKPTYSDQDTRLLGSTRNSRWPFSNNPIEYSFRLGKNAIVTTGCEIARYLAEHKKSGPKGMIRYTRYLDINPTYSDQSIDIYAGVVLEQSIDTLTIKNRAVPHYYEVAELLSDIKLTNSASFVALNSSSANIRLTDFQARTAGITTLDKSEVFPGGDHRIDGASGMDMDPYDRVSEFSQIYSPSLTGSLVYPSTRNSYIFNLKPEDSVDPNILSVKRSKLTASDLSTQVTIQPQYGVDNRANGNYYVQFEKDIPKFGFVKGDVLYLTAVDIPGTEYLVNGNRVNGLPHYERAFRMDVDFHMPTRGACPEFDGYQLVRALGFLNNSRVVKSNILTDLDMDSVNFDVSYVDGVLDIAKGDTVLVESAGDNLIVTPLGTREVTVGSMPVFVRTFQGSNNETIYEYDVKVIMANMNEPNAKVTGTTIGVASLTGNVSLPLDSKGISQ